MVVVNFSRCMVVVLAMLLCGVSCFTEILPAAFEPVKQAQNTKEIWIAADNNYIGNPSYHLVEIDGFLNTDHSPAMLHKVFRFVELNPQNYNQRQKMTIPFNTEIHIGLRDQHHVTDYKKFKAEQVRKLDGLYVAQDGKLREVWAPMAETNPAMIQYKTFKIRVASRFLGYGENFHVHVYDERDHKIAFIWSGLYTCPTFTIPLQNITVQVQLMGHLIISERITSDQLERLDELEVTENAELIKRQVDRIKVA